MALASTLGGLRKTAIEYIKDVPWGTHIAGFFGGKDDLVGVLVPYFKAGLENNEYCLWITSNDLISVSEAEEVLQEAISNFAPYYERGQMEILTHSEWYLTYGDFDQQVVLDAWVRKVEQARARGYDGIRICGSTAWLKKRYWKAFMDYEAEIHKQIGGLNMIALCMYQLDQCDTHELMDVVGNHDFSFIASGHDLQLRDTIRKFDRLDLIGKMAASIAHEIRNPMTTVKGFLQLLQEKDDLKGYNNYFSLVIEEVERANGIISEFLSLARNKSTSQRPDDINAVLLRILPLLEADALKQDKRIALDLSEVPDVLLDKDIRQVILNLARNGLDAMDPGGILTFRTYANGHEVVLEVEDEGHGISPEDVQYIGTPFFSTKENGTGLGLATCYSIIESHEATMDFRTGPTGTTFHIRFKPYVPFTTWSEPSGSSTRAINVQETDQF